MTLTESCPGPLPVAQRRPSQHSIAWSTSKSFTDKPGVKKVNFSWELHVQEFDARSPPHACNPNPYLEMVTEEEGRPVKHFTFDLEEIERPVQNVSKPLFFEFDATDPEWVDQGNGIRARFLFVRHDADASALEGVLFVENRSPNFEFGASHRAYVRYTTDGWGSYKDVPTQTKSLAAFDALHRFCIDIPRDLPSGAAIEFVVCYSIGHREYWQNNHGRNYKAVVGWSADGN